MNWRSEFEAWLVKQEKGEKTVRAYLLDVSLFGQWFEGRYGQIFSPKMLTGADLRSYKQYLVKKQMLKPATVNRRLASLSVFNRWAIESKLLAIYYAGDVRRMEEPEPRPKWLARQDFNRLMATYERAVNAESGGKRPARKRMAEMMLVIVKLMAGGGLRINEALNLNAADVVLHERSGHVVVRQGKGGKYAEVKLPLESRKALGDYVIDCKGELFTSQKGGRISDRQVQRYFQKMLRVAGIEGSFTPHSLRHTFVRRLVEDPEVDLAEVQALARHKSADMTLRYAKASDADLQEAVERVFL